ncbi:MAG: hypothetical protein NDI93_16100 [Pseudomonas sp.]|nr:hypothetical protein [Pseudomonas sp.]
MSYLNIFTNLDGSNRPNIYMQAMNEASPSPEYYMKAADVEFRKETFRNFLQEASENGVDVNADEYLESAEGESTSDDIIGDLFSNTTEVRFYGATIYELNESQIRSGLTLEDTMSDVAKAMLGSFEDIVALLDF